MAVPSANEVRYATREVSDVLASFGYKQASPEVLRSLMDQDILPELFKIFKMTPDENGLTIKSVETMSQKIAEYRATPTFDSLAKARDEKAEKLGIKVAESKLDLVKPASLDSLLFAKQLTQEQYDELKKLPSHYVENMKSIVDFVRSPAKVETFTGNLKTLINAGVIGVKPEPVVIVQATPPAAPPAATGGAASAAVSPAPIAPVAPAGSEASPVAAPSTSTSSAETAPTVTPPAPSAPPAPAGDTASGAAPSAPAAPATSATPGTSASSSGITTPQGSVSAPVTPPVSPSAAPAATPPVTAPTVETPTYSDVADAAKWAERYLGDYAENDTAIPKPSSGGSFDAASQASAWAVISSMKQALGVTNPDGSVDGVYNATVADQIRQKFAAHESYKQTFAQKFGGQENLDGFLSAMDKLATDPGKLATKKPEKKQQEVGILDGFKQSIQEIRGMMTQFLGDEQTTSILRMVFGFIAQFLGPILGRFGINIGPIFSAIGMDEFLDKDGNISPEKMNEAMQKIYTDASQAVQGDPAKLKEEVLRRYDEEVAKGGILMKFANLFTDETARRKALVDSLDAAAAKQGLSVEERAKVFANVAQGKGEAAKAEAPAAPAGGAGGAVHPPMYEQPRPESGDQTPPSVPRGDETRQPPPASPLPRRGDPAPERDAGDVDFKMLGARFLGKDDPGYQMVAHAFAGMPEGGVVTAVQGVNILIGRYEQGELHVYNVNGKLGPLVENQSAGSEMIARSQLVINEQSDPKTAELVGNFHAAAKARYSYDTKSTPEGRMELNGLVGKQNTAAHQLKTEHLGITTAAAFGKTGPRASPMSGAYQGNPQQGDVRIFDEKGLAERVLGTEVQKRFGAAAAPASSEPIILRRGFSIHADPDGEPKATFRDNKKDVEGTTLPPEVDNPYDLRATHAATAEMERGR